MKYKWYQISFSACAIRTEASKVYYTGLQILRLFNFLAF